MVLKEQTYLLSLSQLGKSNLSSYSETGKPGLRALLLYSSPRSFFDHESSNQVTYSIMCGSEKLKSVNPTIIT